MKKRYKQSTHNKWLIALLVLLFLLITTGGMLAVYASLTDQDQVDNRFQLSDLPGTIVEEFIPPTKEEPMTPGKVYSKIVSVENPATTPFFVRVLVTPEILSADGTLLASAIGKELTVDLGKDWLLGEDGYYYYLGKVEAKQTTEPLFTTVKLSENLSASYNDAAMTISIKSETIIAKNTHYREAWWQNVIPTEPELKKVDTTLLAMSK